MDRLKMLDEAMDALDQMVQRTCGDMRFLWLSASLKTRRVILGEDAAPMPAYPPNFSRKVRSASSRTKYQALAGWRQAVVWLANERLSKVRKGTDEEAMKAIYFTPYPKNHPPYAYSSKTSDAPGLSLTESMAGKRRAAARACADTLQHLQRLSDESIDFHKADLIELGLKKSLFDVLKLGEYGHRREDVFESGSR